MSNTCSIDIEGCDCIDPVKILNKKKATAAKRHICNECGRIIEPKEKYENIVYVCSNRKFYVHKTCEACVSIRETFFNGYTFGEVILALKEYIKDVNGDIPSACIVPLTEKAKDLVCSLIDEEFKKKQTKERIK